MVAAWFDRAQFVCSRCDQEAARGGDLRAEHSGKAGSCDGPAIYHPYARHPTGGFEWAGCPRRAAGQREDALIAQFVRCDGRLSATEQRLATWTVLDANQVLSSLDALRSWQAAEDATARAKVR
jgi:hypothetical protein